MKNLNTICSYVLRGIACIVIAPAIIFTILAVFIVILAIRCELENRDQTRGRKT